MYQRVLAWSAIAAASLLIAGLASVHAQSLADVARAEEARRKEIKQPARVYTNKDLVSVPPPVRQRRCPPPTDDADHGPGKPQPRTKDEKTEAEGAAASASEASAKEPSKRSSVLVGLA